MKNPPAISHSYTTKEALLTVLDHIHGDVLDYGCGTAKYRTLILTKGKSYTGLDMDPSHADIVGNVLNPPVPDCTYDTIISNQVLEHVRQPWTMVNHIARILRPGGTCILTAPFMIPYHADPEDYFRFTETGMRTLCEDAGLEVTVCSKYGGLFAVMGETIKQRFFSHYRPQSPMNTRIKPWVERLFRLLHDLCPAGIVYANVLCVARKTS